MSKRQDQFKTLTRKNAREAASALMRAFYWGDSKEGYDYWKAIHDRLAKIGKSGRNIRAR